MSYSIEVLHHFRCSACKLRWSVATQDEGAGSICMACPFCGEKEWHQKETKP